MTVTKLDFDARLLIAGGSGDERASPRRTNSWGRSVLLQVSAGAKVITPRDPLTSPTVCSARVRRRRKCPGQHLRSHTVERYGNRLTPRPVTSRVRLLGDASSVGGRYAPVASHDKPTVGRGGFNVLPLLAPSTESGRGRTRKECMAASSSGASK